MPIVCGDYRLLKVDTLDNRSITDKQMEQFSPSRLQQVQTEAVVFSDFRHGIFNRRTIPRMTGAIPDRVFRVADSQVASRWGNILEFKGFDLITPNEREARFALADQDTGVRPLAAKLHEEADCKTVILKLGDRGVLTCRRGKENDPRSFFVVDSFAAAGGRRGRRRRCAARLCDARRCWRTNPRWSPRSSGSMAAALECECDGNIPVGRSDAVRQDRHCREAGALRVGDRSAR